MNKSLILLVICTVPVFISCKKKYSCECKTTIVDTRPPVTTKISLSTQPINEKLTENQATGACDAIKQQLRETFAKQVVPEPGVSVIVSCNVK